MQAIVPVDIHVESQWPVSHSSKAKTAKKPNDANRSGLRMRTRVLHKTKPSQTKSSLPQIPKQVVIPKTLIPVRSRSSSPDRGPWYERRHSSSISIIAPFIQGSTTRSRYQRSKGLLAGTTVTPCRAFFSPTVILESEITSGNNSSQ